jgi:hypothetical protein
LPVFKNSISAFVFTLSFFFVSPKPFGLSNLNSVPSVVFINFCSACAKPAKPIMQASKVDNTVFFC